MLRVLFVLIVVLAGGAAFPWWWPAVPGVAAGFWRPASTWRSFVAAATGAALAFAGAALWHDVRNGGLLAERIAPVFHLPGAAGLIAVTACIGGVTAGLGALFGVRFRRLWRSLQDALAEVAAPVPEDDGTVR